MEKVLLKDLGHKIIFHSGFLNRARTKRVNYRFKIYYLLFSKTIILCL